MLEVLSLWRYRAIGPQIEKKQWQEFKSKVPVGIAAQVRYSSRGDDVKLVLCGNDSVSLIWFQADVWRKSGMLSRFCGCGDLCCKGIVIVVQKIESRTKMARVS